MAITIHDIRLPVDIERGTEWGPEWSTSIAEADSGSESTNVNWTYPRHSGDISYGIQSFTLMRAVQTFFMGRRGRGFGFLFKDWFDYQLTAEQIGIGDGATAAFQIYKNYADSVYPLARKITRPVSALVVKVSGVTQTVVVDYNISYTTGVITFTGGHIPAAAAPITVTGEYNVPVRFDTDRIPFVVEHAAGGGAVSTGSIPIIEVKE